MIPQWPPVGCIVSAARFPLSIHVRLSSRDVSGIPLAMPIWSSRLSKTQAFSGGLAAWRPGRRKELAGVLRRQPASVPSP